MTTAYISFHAQITEQTAQNLLGATFNLLQQGVSEIVYLLSTPGGSVSSGITVYNTLKGLPIPTTMHNVGNIDSIGNSIFLAGKKRYACPHSTFMFHGVGLDVQNQRLERKGLEEYLSSLKAEERKIGSIITDETSLKSEEVDGLFVQANTKDANFALASGIIHEIRPLAIPKGAPVLQLVF
jgi:ATP-dependent protease ClpP protease subunit